MAQPGRLNFFVVRFALDYRGLTMAERMLLVTFAKFADNNGYLYVSQKKLAAILDCSIDTIGRCEKALAEKGAIYIGPRKIVRRQLGVRQIVVLFDAVAANFARSLAEPEQPKARKQRKKIPENQCANALLMPQKTASTDNHSEQNQNVREFEDYAAIRNLRTQGIRPESSPQIADSRESADCGVKKYIILNNPQPPKAIVRCSTQGSRLSECDALLEAWPRYAGDESDRQAVQRKLSGMRADAFRSAIGAGRRHLDRCTSDDRAPASLRTFFLERGWVSESPEPASDAPGAIPWP